jgi:Tol biopolymer transport system component
VHANLYIMKADGSGVAALTKGDAAAIHPYWGSDGLVYFASNQAGQYDIWRLRPRLRSSASGR